MKTPDVIVAIVPSALAALVKRVALFLATFRALIHRHVRWATIGCAFRSAATRWVTAIGAAIFTYFLTSSWVCSPVIRVVACHDFCFPVGDALCRATFLKAVTLAIYVCTIVLTRTAVQFRVTQFSTFELITAVRVGFNCF